MTSVHELSNDATIGYANEGEIDYKSKQPSVGPLASTQLAGATEEEVIDEEPELHARTWIAIAALFLLNFVQCFALTGTPSILGYIAGATNGASDVTWIPNATALIQGVFGPLYAFASDTYQARKLWLLVPCTIATVGAAVVANMHNVYGVIGGQIMIGFGFATVPLAYCIPSEILPRRWRPMAQALMNVGASGGSVIGPIVAGALVRRSPGEGWRHYFYCVMAFWALTALLILVGYRPPKRHTRLDGLNFWQKLSRLDLPGMLLLTLGLTVLLTGLSLGGSPWAWTNSRVLVTLIVGVVGLTAFGLYEWKGTKTGILHHDLFKSGHAFAVCTALIFIEGIELFPIILFYPSVTAALYETDPFLVSIRGIPFWLCAGASTVFYGWWSTKYRAFKAPLAVGFALYTAGLVGMACVQPGASTRFVIFDALSGIGFGSPLILIIAAVQLATPHHLIATSTAVVTSSRAVAASAFTAIYGAALTSGISKKLPSYIAEAAAKEGLPATSIADFVGAIASKAMDGISAIPGVTPNIVAAGLAAAQQAYADSYRVIYIIAVPFGVVAVILCFFIPDLSKTMHYRVDAPLEEIHAKQKREGHEKA